MAAPDEMLVDLARYRQTHPQTLLKGVHFFPFGGLKRTAEWVGKLVDGRFEVSGNGLTVA